MKPKFRKSRKQGTRHRSKAKRIPMMTVQKNQIATNLEGNRQIKGSVAKIKKDLINCPMVLNLRVFT